MSSVYSLLIGSSQIFNSPEERTVSGVGGEGVAAGAEGVVCGLVERTTLQVWTMCPLIVSFPSRQYFLAWVCVRPGHDA